MALTCIAKQSDNKNYRENENLACAVEEKKTMNGFCLIYA